MSEGLPRSIPALVLEAGKKYRDAEAVVDGARRVTFGELADLALSAAGECIRRGVQPGDRVGIWAPNTLDWVVAALGTLAAGGILVPLNTRYKGEEANWILDRSGSRLCFVSPPFLGNDYPAMLGDRAGAVLLEPSLWQAGPTPDVHQRVDAVGPDDTGDLIFTSGTTGKPKGVVTTQAQTIEVFDTWSRIVGLREADRYLVVNPFFHTFGYKAGIIACLLRGATIVPQPVFDVPAVLDLIERERITVLPGPPTLYQTILDSPDREKRDLSTLRLIVTGAAVVPVVLIERLRDELAVETILTAYGLTEATGTVTMCRQGDDAETIATTSGRAIPNTEVRLVDEAGNEVALGEPGEVVVRGYNVMKGYYEDPEATAQTIDPDGWLHTGDIGVMDADGNVRITDRLKDMYVVGGFNAYPAEVEQALARHEAIAECAVIGVPDERLGEVGMAFVVARPGMTIDPQEVVEWCRERMANFKAPRSVQVVDALPRNASGKVMKFELRAEGLARGAQA
ncbi:MAG TPA: FadD3 family acyl-CoA ligase [Mycobacteriales bacterium]|nr:FadD3 family acyl-CoA ligase [Mycobacteriales bacterium]